MPTPIHERIKIDRSLYCRIRTTSTEVTARGTERPQPVPATPMPGRKLLRIMNFGVFGESPPQNIQLVIGDQGIRWPTDPADTDRSGFGLDIFESIDLPVDDLVPVYALLDPDEETSTADIRTMELA